MQIQLEMEVSGIGTDMAPVGGGFVGEGPLKDGRGYIDYEGWNDGEQERWRGVMMIEKPKEGRLQLYFLTQDTLLGHSDDVLLGRLCLQPKAVTQNPFQICPELPELTDSEKVN